MALVGRPERRVGLRFLDPARFQHGGWYWMAGDGYHYSGRWNRAMFDGSIWGYFSSKEDAIEYGEHQGLASAADVMHATGVAR